MQFRHEIGVIRRDETLTFRPGDEVAAVHLVEVEILHLGERLLVADAAFVGELLGLLPYLLLPLLGRGEFAAGGEPVELFGCGGLAPQFGVPGPLVGEPVCVGLYIVCRLIGARVAGIPESGFAVVDDLGALHRLGERSLGPVHPLEAFHHQIGVAAVGHLGERFARLVELTLRRLDRGLGRRPGRRYLLGQCGRIGRHHVAGQTLVAGRPLVERNVGVIVRIRFDVGQLIGPARVIQPCAVVVDLDDVVGRFGLPVLHLELLGLAAAGEFVLDLLPQLVLLPFVGADQVVGEPRIGCGLDVRCGDGLALVGEFDVDRLRRHRLPLVLAALPDFRRRPALVLGDPQCRSVGGVGVIRADAHRARLDRTFAALIVELVL